VELLWSLVLLACPAVMGVMMWLMMRGSPARAAQASSEPATEEEVVRLRREVDELRAGRTPT